VFTTIAMEASSKTQAQRRSGRGSCGFEEKTAIALKRPSLGRLGTATRAFQNGCSGYRKQGEGTICLRRGGQEMLAIFQSEFRLVLDQLLQCWIVHAGKRAIVAAGPIHRPAQGPVLAVEPQIDQHVIVKVGAAGEVKVPVDPAAQAGVVAAIDANVIVKI